jgi:hypothetical protein
LRKVLHLSKFAKSVANNHTPLRFGRRIGYITKPVKT